MTKKDDFKDYFVYPVEKGHAFFAKPKGRRPRAEDVRGTELRVSRETGVPWSGLVESWGRFKADSVDMVKIAKNRATAVKSFDRVGIL